VKILITTSLLLALLVPAHASKFRESDRKNLPLIDQFGDAASSCLRGNYDDEEGHAKVCKTMDKLMDKIYARGYCYQGMGGVGRPGKRYRSSYRIENGIVIVNPVRRHCYEIDWPQPEPVMKHFKTPQ
jgi:hypothetical protein